MLRIEQVKLQPDHTLEDLYLKVEKILSVSRHEILDLNIVRQSIDARKKPNLFYVYLLDVSLKNEDIILKKCTNKNVKKVETKTYVFPCYEKPQEHKSPIIVGSGPAGLFCAYMLAKHGFKPIILERGECVDNRVEDIRLFWDKKVLKPDSNVQFGEGGAGTFSDGKLNTMIKDREGRNRKILEIFVENGAPREILYSNKPHIGTDNLIQVVKSMRDKIKKWGGDICFNTKFIDFETKDNKVSSVSVLNDGVVKKIDTDVLILAIGHSARDTYEMLYKKGLPMQAKSFAVGVRVEHDQKMINASQYGEDCKYDLPPAPYKVTANLANNRGVYSFCMCPGGYVVNASSEDKHLVINGMSYYKRDGKNANSAIIVTVNTDDYSSEHPLSGIEFQRSLEKKAYELCEGKIPVQKFEDFCENRVSTVLGKVLPQMKGTWDFGNVRSIFPEFIQDSIIQGINAFERQIKGFSDGDTLLSGVESRTSSPVRLLRDELMQSDIKGIFPCGEGAGYAGGITSAAADGIKVAENVAKCHHLFTKK